MTTNVRSQGSFKHLVRTYQYGVEWTHNSALGRPVVLRNTVTESPVQSDGGHATNARWTVAPGLYAPASGSFTVADNDFFARLFSDKENFFMSKEMPFLPPIRIM